MGTNFYMITKNKELIQRYAPYSYTLTDEPDWGYEIHVAKTSCGWLPLFQAHKDGIRSVKQYKEFYGTGEARIFDEYGEEYSWEEFDKRVLQHNGGRLGVEKPQKVPKAEFTSPFADSYMPQYTPVSHLPNTIQSYGYRFPEDGETIFSDEERYEFEEREFS